MSATITPFAGENDRTTLSPTLKSGVVAPTVNSWTYGTPASEPAAISKFTSTHVPVGEYSQGNSVTSLTTAS